MGFLGFNSFYTLPYFNYSFMPFTQMTGNFFVPSFNIFNPNCTPFSFFSNINPFWQMPFPTFNFNTYLKNPIYKPNNNNSISRDKTQNTQNYSSDKGKGMIDYAQQFVNKSSSQMSQIMRGKGYSFHPGVWCADFVSFITGTYLGQGMPDWYKNIYNKSWVGNVLKAARPLGKVVAERKSKNEDIDFSKARPGDIIIFDWQGDSYSTHNDDKTDHIGLVKEVNGNSIVTIEGNNGGKVSEITYSPNGNSCYSNTRSIHSIIRTA